MLSRIMRRRALLSFSFPSRNLSRNPSRNIQNVSNQAQVQRPTLVRAPKPGDGPLMERRPDRELPDAEEFRWGRTLPVFVVLIAAASVAIFNYQKLSSPVVASTLYALRTSARAREYLGDEIYFRHQIPWISGEMNQVRGRIDISFAVRGSRAEAVMRFASHRPSPRGVFETTEWSLVTEDGRVIDLLVDSDVDDPAAAAAATTLDPLRGVPGYSDLEDQDAARDGVPAPTKGFRQQVK